MPFTGMKASHRNAGPFTRRKSLSELGKVSHREALPLTVRPGLYQGDRSSNRKGVSKEGPVSHRMLHNLP